MSIRDLKTIEEKRNFIEKTLGVNLQSVRKYSKELGKAQFTNCENMIGAAQIPLGIAGPVRINGLFAKGDYYLPLATTEGALVASVSRGCKAITQSGGTSVAVEDIGATRGPVFKTSGIKESLKFKKWLDDNFSALKNIASKNSKHTTLKKLETHICGKDVFVRFYFDTDEAMGMNMVTIATAQITKFIKDKTGVICISIAGNFDIDKKPAWLNIIRGRGKKVWAEATIPAEILKQTLKTSAQKMYDVWLSKCILGSAMSGSMGFNAHFANVVAAIFLATGQDVAHTVEGSLGVTTTEMVNNGLYISVYLPSLMIGSIGGGTKLSTQKEALSVMGITGERKDSLKLAEIMGAAVLAGEISLLAALSEGTLAQAHEKLTRGRG